MLQLDWFVLAIYLILMLLIAFQVGRNQKTTNDYYQGNKNFSARSLATSTIATQCSTNSLLGAPAFVGFSAGGGLIWLQYELAVPLAMLLLMFILMPARRLGITSIYEILEIKLGRNSRLTAAGCFLFFRAVATGVTVYGSSLIISIILNIDFLFAVIILLGVTLIYDLLGGLAAVVISDVLQTFIIVIAIIFSLIIIGDHISWDYFQTSRNQTILNDWGVSGNDYGLWPMLFGGWILYAAYYGCDQSQAQRILSTKSVEDTKKVLLLNGIFRFPLVMLYCFLGLGLASLAQQDNQIIEMLPLLDSGAKNYNMIFPVFIMEYFSEGAVGLVIIGLLAAAMSSIDSSLNSLSAVTLEDFIKPYIKNNTEKLDIKISRFCTLFWGIIILFISFQVESIAPTVLEAINKIGSMVNGPLLGLIMIAIFQMNKSEKLTLISFASGIFITLLTALFFENISWLWWNVIGFLTTILISASLQCIGRTPLNFNLILDEEMNRNMIIVPIITFIFIFTICLYLNSFSN